MAVASVPQAELERLSSSLGARQTVDAAISET
jgi:hypothetical protein